MKTKRQHTPKMQNIIPGETMDVRKKRLQKLHRERNKEKRKAYQAEYYLLIRDDRKRETRERAEARKKANE